MNCKNVKTFLWKSKTVKNGKMIQQKSKKNVNTVKVFRWKSNKLTRAVKIVNTFHRNEISVKKVAFSILMHSKFSKSSFFVQTFLLFKPHSNFISTIVLIEQVQPSPNLEHPKKFSKKCNVFYHKNRKHKSCAAFQSSRSLFFLFISFFIWTFLHHICLFFGCVHKYIKKSSLFFPTLISSHSFCFFESSFWVLFL